MTLKFSTVMRLFEKMNCVVEFGQISLIEFGEISFLVLAILIV